jgi:hypothetical protein
MAVGRAKNLSLSLSLPALGKGSGILGRERAIRTSSDEMATLDHHDPTGLQASIPRTVLGRRDRFDPKR